jgi:hypothetical protein
MYKKITHTIVEEHFDHPVAMQIKKTIDRQTLKSTMAAFQTPAMFTKEINDYFTNFAVDVDNIIKCIKKPDQDLQYAQEKAFENVDKLGNIIKPYYGFEMQQQLNTVMSNYILTLTNLIRNLNLKTDTALWVQRLDGIAGDIASVLGPRNTINWNWPTINNILKSLNADWIAEANALLSNNATVAASSKESAERTLSSFASTFSNGVILQYPDRFLPG